MGIIKWLQVNYLLKEHGIFIGRAGKFIEGAGNVGRRGQPGQRSSLAKFHRESEML
jgi:hypothetical protein